MRLPLVWILVACSAAAEHCATVAGTDLELRGENGRELLPEGRVLAVWPESLRRIIGLPEHAAPPVSIVTETATLDGISEISVAGQVQYRISAGVVEHLSGNEAYDRALPLTVETTAGTQQVRLEWKLRVVGQGRTGSGVRYDRYAADLRWVWDDG